MTRRFVGRTCGTIAALSILSTAGAMAKADVIFDNTSGGLNAAGASPASQLDSTIPFDSGAADDFVLPDSPLCRWSITGVRWTGVYWGAAPGDITAFRIMFWGDDTDHPAGDGGATPNLVEALYIYVIPGNAAETPRGAGVFDYEATFPQPFEASPGVRYWIEIQAVMDYPPQWGWHVTTNRQGLGPYEYFDKLRMPAWTPIPDSGDLAFALLGVPAEMECNDGNACTVDECAGGACVAVPLPCDDGNACTSDSCSPQTGCVFAAIACDDRDACTADSCETATGCVHSPINCDDGDECTVDSCVDGTCVHASPPDFDGDGVVGKSDFTFVSSCVAGPAVVAVAECSCADLNGDGRVDLKDYAAFQQSYSGSAP